MSAARLADWERRAEWPLLVLAVAYLVSYAVTVLDTTPSSAHRALLNTVTLGVWVVFGVDYVARLGLAPDRWAFVRRNWFDLIVLALPLLRQLRVLRVLRVLTVLSSLEGRQAENAADDALVESRHEELLTEIRRPASRVAELESVRR